MKKLFSALFVLSFSLLSFSFSAQATTYTVTKTADTNDGSCNADCSLREAITSANADSSTPHTIEFSVNSSTDSGCNTSSGVCTLKLSYKNGTTIQALPTISKSLTINGYSQTGASEGTTSFPDAINTAIKIELSGFGAPNGTDGLTVNAANVTIKGLAIYGFNSSSGTYTAHGIQTVNTSGVTGLKVQGCFIGLKADGETVSKNMGNGIYIAGNKNTGNLIGTDGDGTNDAGERNIFSGNDNYGIWIQGSSTIVAGNFIGTDKDGDTDVGNRLVGIYDAVGSNTIEENLISGNNSHGIRVAIGSNTLISGNIIGMDAAKSTSLKNSGSGINISTTGTAVQISANTIAGNTLSGIHLVSGTGHQISKNSLYENGSNGITLASGANNNKSAPTVASYSSGVFSGTSSAGDTIELFLASSDNEGKTFVDSATADSSGNWTITLSADYQDVGNTFVATATDSSNGSSAFSSAYTVTNSAPTASDGTADVPEDSSTTITLSASDFEGDALTYTINSPSHGSAALSGDTVTYTPAADYYGSDSFVFTATDPDGLASNSATITINVTPVNDAPVASASTETTTEDQSVSITLQASDVDGDALSYTISSTPSHGSVALSGSSATYTPAADFNGDDSFSFVANDGTATSPATIMLTVTAVNDAPVADALSQTLDEDSSASITLSGTDADGDALTYTLVNNPAKGSATLLENTLTYTPNANENGTDSLTYRAYDGSDYSTTQTISLAITPVNDPPTVGDITATVAPDESVTLSLNASDIDGDEMTYSFSSSLVTESGGEYIYAAASTEMTDTFTYTACDDEACASGNVGIHVVNRTGFCDTLPSDFAGEDVAFGLVQYSFAESGVAQKPARRTLVQLTFWNTATGETREDSTVTDDQGCFYATYNQDEEVLESVISYAYSNSIFTYPNGQSVSAPDGYGPDYCDGATWAITGNNAQGLVSFTQTTDFSTGDGIDFAGDLNVAIDHYTYSITDIQTTDTEAATAFHAVDTALAGIEVVCSADSTASFGTINIQKDTADACNNNGFGCYVDDLDTIYYGASDVDGMRFTYTIGHEFAHHLQYKLYQGNNDEPNRDRNEFMKRSDSAKHSFDDEIDARLAFTEGFAAGFGEFIVYQFWGSNYLNLTTDSSAGINKETNVAYVFYVLMDTDGYDKIHSVQRDSMPTTPVFQTLHSFGYYYNKVGGTVEWFADIGIPVASFSDLYDADNLIGQNLGSSHALYPRITYYVTYLMDECADNSISDIADQDDDCYQYVLLNDERYDDPEWCDYMSSFLYGTEDSIFPNRTAYLCDDIVDGYDGSQHDSIQFNSADYNPEIAATASRWFVVDGDQFQFSGIDYVSGPQTTTKLKIADDSGDCSQFLYLTAYKDGDVYAEASGTCPEIDLSADGTYIVEVYSNEITTDIDCFSFMAEDVCDGSERNW